MTGTIKFCVAALAALAFSGAAMAGGMCGGAKAHQASMETATTDDGAPITVADSQTSSTE